MEEKKDWKAFLKKIRLRLLWILLLAACIPGIAAGERLQAGLQQPLSGESLVQNAGEQQEQRGYVVTAETGETADFLVLSGVSLRPGIYRIVIDYEADAERTNSTYASVEGGSYRALLGNPVAFFAGLEQMDYQVWLKEGTDRFAVHVDFGGQGSLSVSDIRIYKSNQGSIIAFLVILLAGLVKALFTAWKKSYGSKTEEYRKGQIVFLILCGTVLIASVPLFVNYFVWGGDLGFHLLRIEGLKDGILSGQIPVRIQPSWLCGHGYATSIFYCDTFLLLPALLRMAGFPVITAYNLYVLAIHIATAGIAYGSFKRFFGSRQIGVLGSVLYTLAPYRMYNVYGRSAVGEYTAMTFLPLICLGFYLIFSGEEDREGNQELNRERNQKVSEEENQKVSREERQKDNQKDKVSGKGRKGWLILALGFTGIIQSHVITCELAAGFSLLLCILLWKRFWRKEVLGELIKAAVSAVIWNLWYLVPFVQYFLSENLTFKHTAARTIQAWGLYPAHLLALWPRAGKNTWFHERGMVDTVPAILGCGLLGAVALFLWIAMQQRAMQQRAIQQREEKKGSGYYRTAKTALVLGCVAMLCSLSLFPWDRLQKSSRLLASLISTIQFPTRFLLVASVCLTVVGCAAAKLCIEWKGKQTGSYVAGALLAAALAGGIFYGNDILYREEAQIEVDAAENMGDGAILGSEYLPYGTDQLMISYTDSRTGPGVTVDNVVKDNLEIVMNCSNSEDESYVDCSLLYYSGYTARDVASGEELAVEAGENGLVRVWLPAGYEGQVRVRYQGMWYWRLAELVSLFGAAVMAVLTVRKRIFRRRDV